MEATPDERARMRDSILILAKASTFFAKAIDVAFKHLRTLQPSLRLEILMASCLKALRMNRAILELAPSLYTEEMSVLLRTLAELVINAAYLQIANEPEVSNYRSFDAIASLVMLNDFEKNSGHSNKVVPELRQRAEKNAAEALALCGLRLSSRSWTIKTVFMRAKVVDDKISQSAFRGFTNSIYQNGHTYTHSAYQSLSTYCGLLCGNAPDESLLMEQARDTMFGATLALQILVVFINDIHDLHLNDEIIAGAELMRSSGFSVNAFSTAAENKTDV